MLTSRLNGPIKEHTQDYLVDQLLRKQNPSNRLLKIEVDRTMEQEIELFDMIDRMDMLKQNGRKAHANPHQNPLGILRFLRGGGRISGEPLLEMNQFCLSWVSVFAFRSSVDFF